MKSRPFVSVRQLFREGTLGTVYRHLPGHLAIERLGGTVPAVSKPIEGSRKSHTWKLKKRAVYLRKLKEMLDIDGRFVELNVLDGG